MSKHQSYCCSYNHKGERWSFQISAESFEDARERLNKIPFATIDGEVVASISLPNISMSLPQFVGRLIDWYRR